MSSAPAAPAPAPAPTLLTSKSAPKTLKCPAYRLPKAGLPDRASLGQTHACLSKKDLRYMDQVLKRVGNDPGPGHYKAKEKADDVVHYTAPKWSYKPPKPGVSRGDVPGSKKNAGDAMYNVCAALDKVKPAGAVWSVPKGPGHRVAMVESCAPPPSTYTPVKGYMDADRCGAIAVAGAVQRLGSRPKCVMDMAVSKKKSDSRKEAPQLKTGPGPGHYKVSHNYTETIPPNWSQSKTDFAKVRYIENSARSKLWVPPVGHYDVKSLIGSKSPLSTMSCY